MEQCYLCGRNDDLTRDHLPPLGFFPEPRPSNLITVPCCRSCNAKWSKEDEAMRAIFSLADIERSRAGNVIWEEKVMKGTVARSPAFREFLLSRMKDLDVDTENGRVELCQFEVPTERVNAFLVRLTKGLIRHFHPQYDYSCSEFTIRHITPDEDSVGNLEKCLVGTKYEERGDGVVRFRYGITDTGLSGIWLLIFYDSVWFLVIHEKRVS